jgi:hypothetical protein
MRETMEAVKVAGNGEIYIGHSSLIAHRIDADADH